MKSNFKRENVVSPRDMTKDFLNYAMKHGDFRKKDIVNFILFPLFDKNDPTVKRAKYMFKNPPFCTDRVLIKANQLEKVEEMIRKLPTINGAPSAELLISNTVPIRNMEFKIEISTKDREVICCKTYVLDQPIATVDPNVILRMVGRMRCEHKDHPNEPYTEFGIYTMKDDDVAYINLIDVVDIRKSREDIGIPLVFEHEGKSYYRSYIPNDIKNKVINKDAVPIFKQTIKNKICTFYDPSDVKNSGVAESGNALFNAYTGYKFWMIIQTLMLHEDREIIFKECAHVSNKKKTNKTKTVKHKQNQNNKTLTKMTGSKKIIILNPDSLDHVHRSITRTNTCWRVSGHYRHYKSGKSIWIEGYWKGPLRNLKRESREREFV